MNQLPFRASIWIWVYVANRWTRCLECLCVQTYSLVRFPLIYRCGFVFEEWDDSGGPVRISHSYSERQCDANTKHLSTYLLFGRQIFVVSMIDGLRFFFVQWKSQSNDSRSHAWRRIGREAVHLLCNIDNEEEVMNINNIRRREPIDEYTHAADWLNSNTQADAIKWIFGCTSVVGSVRKTPFFRDS